MQITIACGSMPFGPDTPTRASLGGSETAALMLGKAIAARGHDVTHFCNLPGKDRPDHFPSGQKHTDGVRYVDLANYAQFITVHQTDLLIVVRDPALIAIPAQAKKKVLWCHDIATKRGMQRALDQMSFTFDEIWAVSGWHKNQIAETTGYPEDRIVALRNGIVKHDDIIPFGRVEKQLIYAARPERGLENLVKPGGIMEHLPDYKLRVAMYEHFPEHMKEFYAKIFAWAKRLPNVELIGGKPNNELRQIIADSEAYIYPTQFEETSCILARECIEQQTPFITTSVGALPETLGDCGVYFEDYLFYKGIVEPDRGSTGWCQLFAMFLRDALSKSDAILDLKRAMSEREDLYWDGVAEMAEPHFEAPRGTAFSRMFSLLQDGDVAPAMAYYHEFCRNDTTVPMLGIGEELRKYDFIHGDIGAYYDEIYKSKGGGAQSELHFQLEMGGQRHVAIAEQIAKLPPGSKVFEYGCGPGHVLAPFAKMFPQMEFVGFDFAKSAVDLVNCGAADHGLTNIYATADLSELGDEKFDAVICSEVLEHVVEPWKLLQEVEAFAKPGGLVICTTPFGAWEPVTYEEDGGKRWGERAHLWAIDREMFMEMAGDKPHAHTAMLLASPQTEWLRPVGNYLFVYGADHKPTKPVDPIAKALRHWPRETCAAALIAYNNEDTILRLLNSLNRQVQFVQIAMGPSTDRTIEFIEEWFKERPWMRYNVIDVPKIEPRVFGFDDARNASIKDLDLDCEWILWIDTDEYLSGEIRKYMRPSALDAYLICQHHFTVEPRGAAAEIDRPARLIRSDRGFAARGHIHEHFEIPAGGPGRCFQLPDVDIGHPGYVNENTRQMRFFRNFPFLEWEHETDPERPLHKFLWFRDILHRMRFTQGEGRVQLAEEAVKFYNDNQKEMGAFGPGLFQSLKYLSEAYSVLNRGVPLRLSIQLDDRNAVLEGRFDTYEQAETVLGQILRSEFTDRSSRYY